MQDVAVLENLRGVLESIPAPWDQLPDLGLYMDQVITYVERQFSPMRPGREDRLLTSAMINNYVKAGLMPRPVGKKYERPHLAVLLMICTLKQSMSMDSIAHLLRMPEEGGEKEIRARYETFRAAQEEMQRVIRDNLTLARGRSGALRFALAAALCRMAADATAAQRDGADA